MTSELSLMICFHVNAPFSNGIMSILILECRILVSLLASNILNEWSFNMHRDLQCFIEPSRCFKSIMETYKVFVSRFCLNYGISLARIL